MSEPQPPQHDPEDSQPESGLADRLRAHTQTLHVQAERSGIVRRLLAGQADRRGYALYLRNLLPAYRALELGLERNRLVPGIRLVARPEFYRADALEADLRALQGASWEQALPLLPAGEGYRRRVAEIAAASPPRLIAYAYVRYLGDLNGGLILRKLLARSLDLDSAALAFYDFPLVDDLPAAKRSYRLAFDLAGRESADPSAIIEEAATAFRLNIAVSDAVHELLTGAADAAQ